MLARSQLHYYRAWSLLHISVYSLPKYKNPSASYKIFSTTKRVSKTFRSWSRSRLCATHDETQSNHENIEKVRQQNSAELSGSTAILHKSATVDRPKRDLQAFWAAAKPENNSERLESLAFKNAASLWLLLSKSCCFVVSHVNNWEKEHKEPPREYLQI